MPSHVSSRRGLIQRLLISLVSAGVLALAAPIVQASNTIDILWGLTYASQSDNNAGCALCHDQAAPSRLDPIVNNGYGAALKADPNIAVDIVAAFRAVEPLNSDGDPGNFSNIEEIDADSQPGWAVGDPTIPISVVGDLDPITGTPGNLQFSTATYSVDENGGSVSITVTRTDGTTGEVTVDYATSNGTATAGSDYTASNGTLTLADGVTSASFDVPILDDTSDEADETVNLALSNATGGATLGSPTSAVLTILDDDDPVVVDPGSLQFSATTYSVNENGGSISISVTRTGGSDGSVTVDYATSDGTATSGSDYSSATGTLTLADGVTSASFDVSIINDADDEPNETVNLSLSNVTGGATLGNPTSAVLTILDDDVPVVLPGSLQFESATYSVDENTLSGIATITVTRTGGSAGMVTVDYATSDGSATASLDYSASIGTLTLADGVTSASFDVPIINDDAPEGDETVNLTLSNVTGGAALGTQSTAVLTIVNDDADSVLQFSSATYSVDENDLSGVATITISRTGNDFGEVTVNYATSDGSATAGSDYTVSIGTVTLPDGVTSASFDVPIIDDNDVEGDETVNLALSDPTGAVLGTPTTAVLTIVDDDVDISLAFASATYSVDEDGTAGMATITVNRTGDLNGDVTVDYATSDGSATAGSDYTVTIGTLILPDGATSASFDVPILDDGEFEGDETVNLALSNATGGATLGTPSTAVLTIVDDEIQPTVQFSGATYSVDEDDLTGVATITVTRTGGDLGVVTVDYATSDVTATAGSDYTASSGTLTLADGVTSVSFDVPIIDDALDEPNETVNLTLSNPTGSAILGSPSEAVLTIVDDDIEEPPVGQLQFSSAAYNVDEDEPLGVATITVTRTNGDFGEVTVDYTTSDVTATAGSDYMAASGTLTLGDGVTSASFDVPIIDDADVEGDETVNLTLSNPTGGAILGDDTAVLTIVDDDEDISPPAVLQFSGATYSVAEDGGSALITVIRTSSDTGEVSVDYATSDGTATAGSDYTATSGTLTLLDGETSASFEVPIIDDTEEEGDETIDLTLSNVTGDALLGDQDTAVLTIQDDEGEDVFLLNLNAAKKIVMVDGDVVNRVIRVFADGTAVQEATVTLSVDAPDGVEVEFEPASITMTVAPGRPATKFFFDVSVECEAKAVYMVTWTATIDATNNSDPTNDTMQKETEVRCIRGRRE